MRRTARPPRRERLNIFPSFRGYERAWLAGDLIAGLMLAAIAIPEQLATARLAGFPPEAGLYAFAAGTLAFAALGANRCLSAGADSTIAPIFAGALAALAASGSPEYRSLAGVVALGAGALLALAGILRAGWIADFLSVPVTTGFLAGISIHIVAGQLPSLLGIASSGDYVMQQLFAIATHLGHINPYALALGGSVLIVTLGASLISERIPGALIGLVGAGFAVEAFGLQAHGVHVLGPLSAGLPAPRIPRFGSLDRLVRVVPLMFVIAGVCAMQTSAVVRSFPASAGRSDEVSGDFAAIGAGSVLASIFGAFAVDASPPRTAVVTESGGRSQLAGLAAVAAIAGVMVFFSKAAADVPEAALAGVLIFIAVRIFRVRDMLSIARYSSGEISLVVASALLVTLLPIQNGMLLGIILSLGHGIYLEMRPPSTELVKVSGSTIWWPPGPDTKGSTLPGVVVFALAAPLNFSNARFVRAKLFEAVAHAPPPLRLLVIEASGMLDVDYTGSQMLQGAIAELRRRGIDVALARLIETNAQSAAQRSGLLAELGADHVFLSVHEAIGALADRSLKT